MSTATLVWLAVIAVGSQLLACLFMDRLHRRRERWSRREALRFELSEPIRRLGAERSRRDADLAAEATVRTLKEWLIEQQREGTDG